MWYVYTCPDGHVTERRGSVGDAHTPCSRCNRLAKRREFNLPVLVGATVAKEQTYRVSEFQEASAEVDYHYTKAENAGMPVKRPDLWGIAKKEARKRGAEVR